MIGFGYANYYATKNENGSTARFPRMIVIVIVVVVVAPPRDLILTTQTFFATP